MPNLNKLFSFKIACLPALFLALFVLAPLAQAQNGTRVYLETVESANGLLTVEVRAENVTDLYGLELHLKYDPALLEIQDSQADQVGVQVEPGTLLPVNQGFVVANQANQGQGTILYALTLLNPAPAVSGGGPIARLTFKVLQDVPATITVEQATLVSSSLQTLSTTTVPLTVGGAQAAAGPVSSSFPWWIVGAVVLGVGVFVLGGLLVLGGFTKKISLRTASEPQARVDKPGQSSGSRPSAFKEMR
jgi:hypothetical protein